jgi:hypothetical protein
MKAIGECLAEAAARRPVVSLRDGEFRFDTGADEYAFDAARIYGPLDAIKWLRHLSQKTWFTPQHAVDFIDALAAYLRIDVFGN